MKKNEITSHAAAISYDCARVDGSVAANKCFGQCHDGDHSMMFVPTAPNVENNCAPGLVVGLRGITGQYVSALGALCGPLPTAVAANTKPIKVTGAAGSKIADNVLICQGGGMTVTPVSGTTASVFVNFAAAPQGANVAQPAAGQCAWSSGPIGSVWKRLGVGTGQPIGQQLVQAAQNGGQFIVEAGTGVTSLGCGKGWCHIQFAGGDGYVAQSYLSVP